MAVAAHAHATGADHAHGLLERLFDDVLLEQGGVEFLRDVGALADAVARWRAGENPSLTAGVGELTNARIGALVRACTMKLALANMVDEHGAGEPDPAEGAQATAGLLRAAKNPPDLDVRLVLTAHPTDVARRSVLTKQRTISAALRALDDPRLTASERQREESEIGALITAEHAACVEALATVTGRTPAGAPSGRRAAWLDALASLQLELIRRLRGGDESAREPLLGTIAGIATGLRVTG